MRFFGFPGQFDLEARIACMKACRGRDTVMMPLNAASHAYLSFEEEALPLARSWGWAIWKGDRGGAFHHHATLCIAAYGFLVAERSRISASARAGKLELEAAGPVADSQARGSSTGLAAV